MKGIRGEAESLREALGLRIRARSEDFRLRHSLGDQFNNRGGGNAQAATAGNFVHKRGVKGMARAFHRVVFGMGPIRGRRTPPFD